jgi:hypothetical protein
LAYTETREQPLLDVDNNRVDLLTVEAKATVLSSLFCDFTSGAKLKPD